MSAALEPIELRIDSDALKAALSGPDGAVAELMTRVVVKGERYAKERCPVDTGRLRASITSRIEDEGEQVVGVIGTDVEYAVHVEYGANGRPPAAFLRGGADQAIRDVAKEAP